MSHRIVVVGAGMGGLAAALRLKQRGFDVLVLEARDAAGGLASGFQIDGIDFDAGPYILLDLPGLEWTFRQLNLNLRNELPLHVPDPVYEVHFADGSTFRIFRDLERTAELLEASQAGSGAKYRVFVGHMQQRYDALRLWMLREHPKGTEILTGGAWKHVPFLLQSLERALDAAALPEPVKDVVGIWTHVAGQSRAEAPSPMGFVSALIHSEGAFYPRGGIRAIPEILASQARSQGVEFRFQTSVLQIIVTHDRVEGVLTENGERIECSAVVSNAHGLSTYENLVRDVSVSRKRRLLSLPLQSPGVCLYLKIRRGRSFPYLRFFLPGGDQLCRLFVSPGNLADTTGLWEPARIIAPMRYEDAQRLGPEGQQEFAEKLLSEVWWREGIVEFERLQVRTPSQWGAEFHLFRDSMNPVMTAALLRSGRLAHRSPWIRKLYLAGSSTDPGQWVSFCGISGILAADRLIEDFS